MGVDPEARQQGIGTSFYEARKELIRERGIKRLLTGGRIAGYADVADEIDAEGIRGRGGRRQTEGPRAEFPA
jgi:GNAT superfamily N-acetyltransferase